MAATSSDPTPRLSQDRAGRLYKLLAMLESAPATRLQLMRKLKVGMRTFYRDSDLLRRWEVNITHQARKYHMEEKGDWRAKLPFPDPELSFADAEVLSRGNSKASKRLKEMLNSLTS